MVSSKTSGHLNEDAMTKSNSDTPKSSRSEPSSLTESPEITIGEERFEAFGSVDEAECNSPSPTAGISNKDPKSPNNLIARNSWFRTSLGRTAGANKKRLSSNALASQLYRSSSFNSSGRGSICDTAEDVYSDASLEEDVIDLNHRVQMIQEQMHVLVDTQSVETERYVRVKQENATLQTRILMLEESSKEAETRAEEKLEMEQRRHRELISRLEREKQLQLENAAIKLQAVQVESDRSKEDAVHLREQIEKLKREIRKLENSLDESRSELEKSRESERRSTQKYGEASRALERAELELASRLEDKLRIEELTHQVDSLRTRNKCLEESRDELQAAAAALQAGRKLLMSTGQDPNQNTIDKNASPSLATELLLTARDQTDDVCDNYNTVSELKQALKEQIEVNARLRSYIDNILLNIVENNPQLLEVGKKQPQ